MYDVDGRDRVTELAGVPQSSVGTPTPLVVGDENRVVLAYYVEVTEPSRDRVNDIAIVRFTLCYAHMFGPPNDEAFAGHPLASRGLRRYGASEVSDSSWIRRLEKMNSVHPCHRPDAFWQRRHLVFAFHDSTFECVCDAFEVSLARGPIRSLAVEMMKFLDQSAAS